MLSWIITATIILHSISFGFSGQLSVTHKVTEKSKEMTEAANFVSNAIEATAELEGISIVEASQKVKDLLSSKTGLKEDGSLLDPIGVCAAKSDDLTIRRQRQSTCRAPTLRLFIPIGPAGFPSGGIGLPLIPHPKPCPKCRPRPSPDCEGIFDNCLDTCPNCIACSKFRTIDGTCNNLQTSSSTSRICPRNWGSINQAFIRVTPNKYDDSLSVPTGGQPPTGSLPTAREVSNYVHDHATPPADPDHTLLLMQLGQFIDHDITFTPEVEVREGCCPSTSPECFPLKISPSDPDFPPSITCRPLARSAPKCHFGPIREQFNAITAYLDASQIYGSEPVLQNHLRTLSGGKLRVKTKNGEDFLPLKDPCGGYSGADNLEEQFQAGDRRVTENPGLQGLHTIFLREHNRIAEEIDLLLIGDERIYQEARRILIAEWQNIVYNEFLPAVLGPDAPPHTTDSTYNINTDASIANVFATAAFRFGHTLVEGQADMFPTGNYQLNENFGVIDEIYNNGNLDNILRGNANQKVQASDKFLHDHVRNTLFKNLADNLPGIGQVGTDLAARNIKRGRDHGLGSYLDYRSGVCGNMDPIGTELEELADDLYSGDQSNIEIFPGGLMEPLHSGSLVGPTFSCLIRRQFQNLKDGDRFFFTHKKESCCQYNCQRFTSAQQTQLKMRTLRDIMCENTNIEKLQLNVLKKATGTTGSNPLLPCYFNFVGTKIYATNFLNIPYLVTPDVCPTSTNCNPTTLGTLATLGTIGTPPTMPTWATLGTPTRYDFQKESKLKYETSKEHGQFRRLNGKENE